MECGSNTASGTANSGNVVKMVNVNGIGSVTDARLLFKTDAINYERGADNFHNETNVKVQKGGDSFFNDDTTVEFSCGEKACVLTMTMDSEVPLNLYNRGKVELTFDRLTKNWSMKGFQTVGALWWKETKEWSFCNPSAVVDHVTAVLNILSDTFPSDDIYPTVIIDNKEWFAAPLYFQTDLIAVAQSIKVGKEAIVASAALFANRDDCSAPPPSQQEDSSPFPNGTIPMD